jgi:hypothetical protein
MKVKQLIEGRVEFICPGCGYLHCLNIRPSESRPSWEFNGDYDKPTFQPSILMKTYKYEGEEKIDICCHSFVTDGKIQFLSDCTHELAGQTIELPDLET